MTQQGKAYTTKQKVAIIDRIADKMMDGQSLRKICSGKDFPPKTTVLRWLADDENSELVTIIAEARNLQSEAKFDEMDEIMGEVRRGELDAQSARLIIWAMQWQLSKIQPKKYGDKQFIEQKNTVTFEDMSDDDLRREIASLEQQIENESNA